MGLLDGFQLIHVQVLNVGIINKNRSSQMRGLFGYRAPKVDLVALAFVCIKHCNAVHCLTRRRRAIPMAHALGFYTPCGASELFGVLETCSEEELHVLIVLNIDSHASFFMPSDWNTKDAIGCAILS
jgi:hypothetical protein